MGHLKAAEAFEAAAASPDSKSPAAFAAWKTAQARHWLAVMKGDNTATAPPEYVASLFDSYAEHFEDHLVQKLQYNTPALLADDIRQLGMPTASWQRGADLGCGTGLMCPPLRDLGFKGRLEGVDLSEAMLLQALKKGGPSVGYSRLLCGDILDIFVPPSASSEDAAIRVEQASEQGPIDHAALVAESSLFELVVASDVFVYIGDLEPTFQRVSQWLARGGIFAFSTEALAKQNGVDYKLNDTGRYTHSLNYIERLAAASGLQVCSSRAVVLRMNAGKPVNGHVHVLRSGL